MLVVALTGGIGSGKSTVADLLSEFGAHVLRSDDLAREVVAPGSEGLAAITARFGPGILLPDGSLDRSALAGVVFRDPEARRDLEAITHPRVRTLTRERIAEAAASGAAIVIVEIPLLLESGRMTDFDVVVAVEAPVQVRLERLRARGLSEDEAQSRMAQQATDEQRRSIANYVLDNAGDPARLRDQAMTLWDSLCRRAGAPDVT